MQIAETPALTNNSLMVACTSASRREAKRKMYSDSDQAVAAADSLQSSSIDMILRVAGQVVPSTMDSAADSSSVSDSVREELDSFSSTSPEPDGGGQHRQAPFPTPPVIAGAQGSAPPLPPAPLLAPAGPAAPASRVSATN